MDGLREEQCSSLAIDHLGLVADKIEDLGIISLIDERLSVDKVRAKTSMGERVAAMILNGLGFVDSRLYVFSEFFSKRPISRLFGKPMDAKWFNDDALGRCLDAIAEYGTTKLFTEISFTIGKRKKLLGRSVHFDTTTLQVYGEYDVEDEGKPIPAYGYSKSKRHDLKQMVLNLATTGKAAFPVWMESHSGNCVDKKILPNAASRMQALCQQLSGVDDFLYVGDSALYSNILPYSDQMKWLTRVPNNILPAKKLLLRDNKALDWQLLSDGYRYHVCELKHGGVQQRWVLIHSKASEEREAKTLNKRISKAYESYQKLWWHLGNEVFVCQKDASQAAKKLIKKMKYHSATYEIVAKTGYAKKGRPSSDNQPTVKGYQLKWHLQEDEEAILMAKRKLGRFILSTNELDKNKLPDTEVLSEYKAQSGTEQGFKFIKDKAFQVDAVFLKTPHRIDALMMVMTLCLLVYGVSQYELRQALQSTGDTVPDQKRKPTHKPSMKWVYFLFQGVQEWLIHQPNHTQTLVVNVNDVLRRVVNHFGHRAQSIYLNSG